MKSFKVYVPGIPTDKDGPQHNPYEAKFVVSLETYYDLVKLPKDPNCSVCGSRQTWIGVSRIGDPASADTIPTWCDRCITRSELRAKAKDVIAPRVKGILKDMSAGHDDGDIDEITTIILDEMRSRFGADTFGIEE